MILVASCAILLSARDASSVGGLELLEEAHVVLGEHAEVLDLVLEVGDALEGLPIGGF